MYGTPCRAHASTASARLARSAVIWLKLSLSIPGDPGDPGLAPGVSPPGVSGIGAPPFLTRSPPAPALAPSAARRAPDRAAARHSRRAETARPDAARSANSRHLPAFESASGG